MFQTQRRYLIVLSTIAMTSGCAVSGGNPTPQQQLQSAELVFTAAEGVVTALEASNVIKPAAAAQIAPFEQAAAAALSKASADISAAQPGQQTSLDALNAAVAAYSQAVVQLKTTSATAPAASN